MKKIKLYHYLLFTFFLLNTTVISAQEKEDAYTWPKELVTENKTVITLYQPQLESFEGVTLESRIFDFLEESLSLKEDSKAP